MHIIEGIVMFTHCKKHSFWTKTVTFSFSPRTEINQDMIGVIHAKWSSIIPKVTL